MEHRFWRERWDEGQIGFHRAETHPLLERFWPELDVAGGRVLVPLCGKSLDLSWLAANGYEVVGVEFVPAAAAAYFEERGVAAEQKEVEGFATLRENGVTLVVADFFQVSAAVTGRFDAVYDRAAWVAIAPEDRRKYTERVRSLVRPGGRLLLINFEHDLGSGPPFSIGEQELRATWQEFSLELHFECDILEGEPRFRERGASYFREQVWFGTARG